MTQKVQSFFSITAKLVLFVTDDTLWYKIGSSNEKMKNYIRR